MQNISVILIRSGFCLLGLGSFFVGLVSAQEQEIPPVIVEECYLQADGTYIDYCPSYRQEAREINTYLYDLFAPKEANISSAKDMILLLNKFLINLQQRKKRLFLSKALTKDNLFTLEYLGYIVRLYIQEIQQRVSVQGSIASLFEKTYFQQEQSGLSISSVSLYQDGYTPQVYTTDLKVSVLLRNFTSQDISATEDVYCFATVGQEDHIFPFKMGKKLFEAGGVKVEIVGMLNFEDTMLMTVPGEKTLYCMVVYQQDGQEYTSPFVPFHFMVE